MAMTEEQQFALWAVYDKSFGLQDCIAQNADNLDIALRESALLDNQKGKAQALGIPSMLIKQAEQMGHRDFHDGKPLRNYTEFSCLQR